MQDGAFFGLWRKQQTRGAASSVACSDSSLLRKEPWKSAKERFAIAHADEVEQYKKAQRLLHKFGVSHPIDHKSLRAEKAHLEQDIEALRPDVDAVQAELDELKTVRYWVRKVIPDALPSRTESGSPSVREAMETYQNTNELSNLLVQTTKQIADPNNEITQHTKQHQHNETL